MEHGNTIMKRQHIFWQQRFQWLLATLSLCIHLGVIVPASAQDGSIVLVDFGATAAENTYSSDWRQEILGPQMEHTTINGHSGTRLLSATDPWDNYQGLGGSTTLNFQEGDEIRVTWYNSSTQPVSLSSSEPALISFEDLDKPVDTQGEAQWYWMTHTTTEAGPQEQFETVYVITSARTQEGDGTIAPTEGKRSSVNISLSQANPAILCERIEYVPADIARPGPPTITQAASNSSYPSAQIDLSWNAVKASRGVDYYKIYRNGIYVNRTEHTSFTDAPLESGKAYTYTITAIDIVNPAFLQPGGAVNSNINESQPSAPIIVSTTAVQRSDLLNPQTDIEYLGAFKLDGGASGASRWSYRNGSIAFYPDGDPGNQDAYPGSLYGWGHIYHDSVAEISIPEPVLSKNWDDLNTPETLQVFHEVRPAGYEEYGSKAHQAITYLPVVDTLYTIFASSYNVSYQKSHTHASFRPDFSEIGGKWWIGDKTDLGDPHYYAYVNFLFGAPLDWAQNNDLNEKVLISGGSRPGPCLRGPGLIAIQPWSDAGSRSQPAPEAELDFAKLVYYGAYSGSAYLKHPKDQLTGWIENDGWSGGAWLETEGKSGIVVSGSKALGEYYYGDEYGVPRSHQGMYVPDKLTGKGGASTSRQSLMIFYDPQELGEVAQGVRESWRIQPYTAWVLDDYMFRENLYTAATGGSLKGLTYDREHGLLYAVEHEAVWQGEPYDVVHVFQVGSGVAPEKHSLSISKTGTGDGAISSSPSGIDCGSECRADFTERTTVTLTANPAADSVFEGWTGADNVNGTICTVTMDQARRVIAAFALNEQPPAAEFQAGPTVGDGPLSVQFTERSTNAPTSWEWDFENDGLIDSNEQHPSHTYPNEGRYTVTLTVSNAYGTNTATKIDYITVNPAPLTYPLSVNTAGSGQGTIISDPGGIDCGSACSQDYAAGTQIILNAISSPGSAFAGWSGACSGLETTCQVSMNAAIQVGAVFTTTEADVIMAESGTAADIKAACEKASPGDTIQIPAGTFNFNSGLDDDISCDAGITIKGAGQNSTILKSSGLDTGMLKIDGANGLPFTFSDITWEGPGGGIYLTDVKDFLVIDSTFKNVKEGAGATNSHGAVKVTGDSYGVIAHSQFLYDENAVAHSYGIYIADNPESWEKPLELGTRNAVFVEDCYFEGGENFKHVIASNNGAKYVFRYNTIRHFGDGGAGHIIDAHGTLVPRGSRSFEIYENTIVENQTGAINIRGGDGVIFNNQLIGSIILSNEATWGNSDCAYPCGDQTTDLYVSGNSTSDGAPITNISVWDYNLEENRDYYLYEKPGYTPYTYPHPLVSGSSSTSEECTEFNWTYSDEACQPANTLTRTWTKIGTCDGGVSHPATETLSCTYIPPRYTLSVHKNGTGRGLLTSSPAGITCGEICSADFDEGTLVSLIALPDTNAVFVSWNGDCSGTGACAITMNANAKVTATFLADTDGDGVPDDLDSCPADPNKIDSGLCGCGVPDTDSDNDGTPDCVDGCPEDPGKIEPGVCGCGQADIDSDTDGVLDCNDNCPDAFNPTQLDSDHDGVGAACEAPYGTLNVTQEQTPAVDSGGDSSLAKVHTGDILTYSFTMTNLFEEAIGLLFSDSLSALVDYVAGTFSVNGELSNNFYFSDEGFLEYEYVLLAPTDSLMISFDVIINDDVLTGSIIENMAWVTPWYFGSTNLLTSEMSNIVEAQVTEPVPEPSTLSFFGIGVFCLLLAIVRKKQGSKSVRGN